MNDNRAARDFIPCILVVFIASALMFGTGGWFYGKEYGVAKTRREAVSYGAGRWDVEQETARVIFRWNVVAEGIK